jgi:uncharacterized protein YecE (DUF72 family)
MARPTTSPAMTFGHLQEEELNSIKFSLPADGPFTKKLLSRPIKNKVPHIYVGCAKWGRKEWVGNLYPEKTKEAAFLDQYIQHFKGIELNATHYKIYTAEEITAWTNKAGKKDFKFCPKVPQSISHFSDLVSPKAKETTDKFLTGIVAFKAHLGPTFLQLSDRFSPARKNNLYTYLESLPKQMQFFVEVRHAEWFADKAIRKEFFDTLHQLKVGAVILDTAGRRDCVHAELTVPKAFIRFTGNNLHPTDYTRIDQWIKKIKKWLQSGLQELYFFMHQPDETFTPEACNYVVNQLNKHCHTNLMLPMKEPPGK